MLRYIFLIILLSFTNISLPCICVENRSVNEIIEQFKRDEGSIIFRGKLIYRGIDSTVTLRNGNHPMVNIFTIDESWIGIDTSVTEIKLFNTGACDYRFINDSTYLVYSKDLEGIRSMTPFYITSSCFRNRLFSEATEDLKILGLSKRHQAVNKKIEEVNESEINYQLYLLIVSILLNIILLIFIVKRRKNFQRVQLKENDH